VDRDDRRLPQLAHSGDGLVRRIAAVACIALAVGGCGGRERRPEPPVQDFAPRLHVEQRPSLPGRATALTIDVMQRRGERALRRADIVVPSGFRIVPPPRGSVGELDAAVASPRGDRVVAGELMTAAGGGACTDGRATPLLARLGPAPSLRVAVAVLETGGATRLTVCPERTDHDIRRLTIRLNRGLTSPGVGDAVWRGIFTPAEGDATESRAVVPAPSFLTLEADVGAHVRVGESFRVRGYLLQREAQPRRQVRILAGAALDRLEVVGRATTRANGSYFFTLAAPQRPGVMYVAARAASVESRCAPADGCTTTTLSGVSSAPLRLTVVR
jgi:hypothetical protein